ncbi:MAG: leucyl aminopeptidase family protein [Bauldia sp.]|nr:leucyl aminopeptidase family protein [Bauldia sp.]
MNADASASATEVVLVGTDRLAAALDALPKGEGAFARASAFQARSGSLALLPSADGKLARVLLGIGTDTGAAAARHAGRLFDALPPGAYKLAGEVDRPDLAALFFALGAYRFDRYKSADQKDVKLVVPDGVDGAELRLQREAVTWTRDLINIPANDLGPAELSAAARELAEEIGATFTEITADHLAAEFPLIATVGAAAAPGREPCLIDIAWGNPDHPKVTLVGKGICFDTGGLDIKPSAGMLLMKKDMGGAANALGLAAMIIGAALPVRLRVLVAAAENAIAGPAFRPGDVFKSRKGLTVEIGNTDAEGRLVLADALALASEESPDLLIDFATLTGAARVALGPELPAVFTRDDALAADLARAGLATADPSWRLPLWSPYLSMMDSKVANINNAGTGSFAGSITAALFLEKFVGDGLRWLHVDLFAWNPSSRPGSPEGGEAQTIRSLYQLLKERYVR